MMMSDLTIKVFELSQCAGCQSCLRLDENDDIQKLDHFIASKDVTEEIQTLHAKVASAEVLVKELQAARRAIRSIKRCTNKYEEGRELCIKADKRITKALAAYDKLSEVKHDTK